MTPNYPLPLRADPTAVFNEAMRSLTRAAIVTAERAFDGGMMGSGMTTKDFLERRNWNDDRLASMLTRAASGPATTFTTGWASQLATVAYALLATLRPMSAGAELLGQCLQLSFGRAASITMPGMTGGVAGWVAEGDPIRAVQFLSSAGPTLTPHKLASISELTREMMENSNAEQIVRQSLIDSTAPALDNALFSSTAADASRPAGILLGVTPITASTSTDAFTAIGDDLGKLAQAIAPYVGNGSIAIVAAPAQAMRIALYAQNPPFTVLMSAALAAGTVVAVATSALVSAIEPVVIDAARSVSIHAEDTNPQPLGGTTSPTHSVFQKDCVALRMKMPVTWVMRNAGGVAITTSVKW